VTRDRDDRHARDDAETRDDQDVRDDRDPLLEDGDAEDIDPDGEPRSLFSVGWFRAVLVFAGAAVVAAIAVPYVVGRAHEPAPKTGSSVSAPAGPAPSAAPVAPPVPVSEPARPAPAPADVKIVESAPAPKPVTPPAEKKPAAVRRLPAPPAASTPASAPRPKVVTPAAPETPRKTVEAATGTYWVQVGAFKDPDAARRLAERLREQKFPVTESTPGTAREPVSAAAGGAHAPPSGGDRYEVLVSGPPPAELNARLTAKGFAVDPDGDAVVVRPSRPLPEAVALSRDLAGEGFQVQVRRTAAPAVRTPPGADVRLAAAPVHRVRVGAFGDRAAAAAAVRELEARGYKPFIARNGE
jgi:cell division septation protein DedD